MPLRATKPEHPGTSSTAGLGVSADGKNTRKGSAASDTLAAMATAARAIHGGLLRPVSSAMMPTAIICPAYVQGNWRQSGHWSLEHGRRRGECRRGEGGIQAPAVASMVQPLIRQVPSISTISYAVFCL